MWYPKNSLFSTENFTSLATGDIVFSNFNEINNLGGYIALRNISTATGVVVPPGQPWPSINWTDRVDFTIPTSVNVSGGAFGSTGGTAIWNPAYGTTSLTGTTRAILSNKPIKLDTGYLVECGLMLAAQTGTITGSDNLYGLIVQQGTGSAGYRDTVLLTTSPRHGLWLNKGHATEAFVPVENLDSSIVNFRIGRRNNELQLIADNGYSVIVTGSMPSSGLMPFSGVSVGSISAYGTGLSTDPAARIELNHLYLKYPVADIAGDFISDTDYRTGNIAGFIADLAANNIAGALAELSTWPRATLAKFTPQKPIRGYSSFTYKMVGDVTDGMVVIGALLDDGTPVVIEFHTPYVPATATGGIYTKTSETLTQLATYTGSLNMLVYCVGQYGTYKPTLAMEYMTICVNADDHDGVAYLYPEYGSSDGDYPVVIAIDPQARGHVGPPSEYDSSVISLVRLQDQTTGHTDVGSTAGTTRSSYSNTGLSFINGYLGSSPRSFDSYSQTGADAVDQIFTTFSSPPIEGINYRSYQVGSRGRLLASTGFQFLWASGSLTGSSFTGAATGTGGYWLLPYQASGLTTLTTDTISYEPVSIIPPNSNGSTYILGQRVRAREGYGFQTQYINGSTLPSGDLIIESTISCTEGGVGIGVIGYDSTNTYVHTGDASQYVVYPSQRFASTQKVRTLFPRPTGRFLVNVVGLNPSTTGQISGSSLCDFTIADINIGTQSGMGVDFYSADTSEFLVMYKSATTYASGCTMDLWVKPNGFGMITNNYTGIGFSIDPVLIGLGGQIDHSVLMKTYALNGFTPQLQRSILMDRAGFPVFTATTNNGSQVMQLRSEIGLETNKWNHVSAVIGQSNSVGLYVNGELAAYDTGSQAVTFSTSTPNITVMSLGSRFCGHLEYSRIRNYPRTPAQVRALDAFTAPPRFLTSYEIGTGGTFAYYKFGKGTVQDYSSNGNHCIIPESGNARIYTERSVEGVIGDGIAFNNNYGYAYSVKNAVYDGSGYSVGGYLACLTDTGLATRVFSLGSSSLTIKNNKLVYEYSGKILTGTTDVVNPFAYRPFMIAHQFVSGSSLTGTHIWGYVGTGQGTGNIGLVTQFSGFSTGSTKPRFNSPIYLGHNSSNTLDIGDLFLDQIFFHTGTLNNLDHIDYRRSLSTPTEGVYLDGSGLSTSRIGHIGVYEKEIFMPARTDFTSTGSVVNVTVDSDAGRIDVSPAFTYINTRYLIADPVTREKIEDISDKICKTKSPFRIGARVPLGGVNLAYMTTTPATPESTMSVMDGADSLSQNLVNAVRTYELTTRTAALANGYPDNKLVITGQVNTDDFLLSSYSMIRPDSNFPAPLFYYHRLGYESVYPMLIGGTGSVSGDFSAMRDSIYITDENGSSVALEDFPWDIRMSKYKEDGTILPENVYSVDLLSRDKFIYNKTLFANYNAANPINNYQPIRNHTEVINPIPIYRRLGSNSAVTGETFTVQRFPALNDLSSTNVSNAIAFTINMRTGAWTPYLHDIYISKEEMPEI